MKKICSRCKIEKSISEFNKKKNGYQHLCRECQKQFSKEYYEKNKDKVNQQKREYRKNNLEKVRKQEREGHKRNKKARNERCKEWHKKNRKPSDKTIMLRNMTKEELKNYKKTARKKYYQDNREKILEKQKKYNSRPEQKEKRKKYINEYIKNRNEKDKDFKMKNNVRDLFRKSFYDCRVNKYNSFFSYTEISIETYIDHFQKSKYWNDYCNGENIHIDHIIPVSAYDFNNLEEIRKCWQPENLRLLPAEENLSKFNKIDYDLVEKYNIKHLLPE